MTKIKLCGLMREEDVEAANACLPDYVGFMFAKKSRRFLSYDRARELRALLRPEIQAVGVFAGQEEEEVAMALESGLIDVAQLHGEEDASYLRRLRALTKKPLIQAFRIRESEDIRRAEESEASFILLDSGGGTGRSFDWELARGCGRPYFLAGGLTPENVGEAVRVLSPYGVDVSSGIETDGKKDRKKMIEFVTAVRRKDGR